MSTMTPRFERLLTAPSFLRKQNFLDAFKKRLAPEIVVRVLADIGLLNISLIFGLFVRTVIVHDEHNHFVAVLAVFLRASLFLSTIGPIIFATMGFYTKGRFYASRYKAVAILQATTLLFLIFGFTNFLLGSREFSRLVVVITWAVALSLIEAARFWTWVWEHVVERESSSPAVESITPMAEERRILLIGGAGYIGSGLLPHLLDRGYKVRLLDGFIYGEEPIADCLGHPNLEIMKADFRNLHDVVCAMRGIQSVIHLGAIVGDPACSLDEDLTVEVNLLATRTIAEVAKANGVRRMIFASTCSVYGASNELLDERSAIKPVSLYARSKIACERVLLTMRDNNFTPVILRFGTVYGLSGRTRFDLVVNLLAAKAMVDGRITVIGKDQWRPFLHVHDAGRAVLAALEARPEQLSDAILNVGSDEQNYTLGQIGKLVQSMVPTAELICSESMEDPRNYRVNFSRIRMALNFKPEWTLESGIQQVVDAIRSGEVIDYHHPKYSNVKFLSEQNGHAKLKTNGNWAKEMLETLHAA
jgi:nucleoside-diphosphate-sugar epimerase